ncbi:MAG: hypothetical protein WDW38_010415 [Sanguina aurantia]
MDSSECFCFLPAGTAWFNQGREPAGPGGPQNKQLIDCIKQALSLGFTHLDAAEMYGTESEGGAALSQYLAGSGKKREELWVTSKVMKSLPDAAQAVRDSLQRLQTPYLDLYLIHSPFLPEGASLKGVWQQMEACVDQGLVKSIGVSNFRISDLEELFTFARIRPVVNQIEFHPYLQQPELSAFHTTHGVLTSSYGPLTPLVHAKGGPLDPLLSELAKKHDKTPEQVLLRWNLQKGNMLVTTSSKPERMAQLLSTPLTQVSKPHLSGLNLQSSSLTTPASFPFVAAIKYCAKRNLAANSSHPSTFIPRFCVNFVSCGMHAISCNSVSTTGEWSSTHSDFKQGKCKPTGTLAPRQDFPKRSSSRSGNA